MNYTFETLSPVDLEVLVGDLLQAEFDLLLERFKRGQDRGIDLRCARDASGTLVVQCKHYRASGLAALLRHLRKEEAPKVHKLLPDRYILATTVPLSPTNKEEIREIFAPYVRGAEDVFGPDDLNALLARHTDVERRHFKLWLASSEALDRFFSRAVSTRSDALIARAKAKLHLYAQNDAFPKALEMLSNERVCVVAGSPGIGKTTLADVLMVHHLDQGYEIVEVSQDIEEANEAFRAGAKQLFYYDDFLGTAFDELLPKNEDSRLLAFLNRVVGSKTKRIVLTTREYILRSAQGRYERLGDELIENQKYVLSLSDYSKGARARILYNHVYFSALNSESREVLVSSRGYEKILHHRNFNPRAIEHGTKMAAARGLEPQQLVPFLVETLERPITVWEHAFRSQLNGISQAILLMLAVGPRPLFVEDVIAGARSIASSRDARVPTHRETLDALRVLEGTFATISRHKHLPRRRLVAFSSPAVLDYLLTYLDAEPDELNYLFGELPFFEHVVGVCQSCVDELSGRNSEGLALALKERASTVAAAIHRTIGNRTCIPARGVYYRGGYKHEPSQDRRILELLRLSQSTELHWLAPIAGQLVAAARTRWIEHTGDRDAIAGIATQVALDDEVLAALREWSQYDLSELSDFALAAAVTTESEDCDAVDYVRQEFERIVEEKVDFILNQASDFDEAAQAKDELESTCWELGFLQSWDDAVLEERLSELSGPDETDFDDERALMQHARDRGLGTDSRTEAEEIYDLFRTLVDAPSNGA